jgi:hypothetical protein
MNKITSENIFETAIIQSLIENKSFGNLVKELMLKKIYDKINKVII